MDAFDIRAFIATALLVVAPLVGMFIEWAGHPVLGKVAAGIDIAIAVFLYVYNATDGDF